MKWPFHHRHKAKNIAAVPQTIQGIQLSSSAAGLVVPIVYGQARVAGKLIHAEGRFAVVPPGSAAADIANTQPIAMALCEGPITGVVAAWVDKDYLGPADVAAVFASGLYYLLFLGTSTQAAWAFLSANYPSRAVPYQSTAYIANPYWPAGAGATLSNWSWEVKGLLPWGGGILDSNPKDIVTDFLTDSIRGALFPSALLADLTQFRDYCTAAGIFLSPVFDTQRPARDHLQEILAACNSEFVWSDGKLKIVPYADQPITGNGVTFTPNTTPVYNLTDNDFIADGQDPVRVVRRPQSDVYNMIQVEFDNRAKNYDGDIAPADDQVSIEAYGLRPAPVIKAPFIKDATIARLIARLALQRQVYIRNTYEFKLGIRYVLLEPMDLVTLTDANLGLFATTVRLTQIVEEDDDTFTCTAEEWPFGIATAAAYATVSGAGFSPAVPSSASDISLIDFRKIAEDATSATYGWKPGARVSEVWSGYLIFASPVSANHWDAVVAAVSPLPIGTTSITVPKPAANFQGYLQVEPRMADLTPGIIRRVELSAERDTVPLNGRGRVLTTSATQLVVRYAVADPFPQGAGSVTITYQDLGSGGVTPAPGGTITPESTITENAGTYIDYTITRPPYGTGTGRVTFTAAAANRINDNDSFEIPEQASIYVGTTRPRCSLLQSVDWSIPTGTITAIGWDLEYSDIGGLHDTVTNNSRITIPAGAGGVPWFFLANIGWDGASTVGQRRVEIWKNGVPFPLAGVSGTDFTPVVGPPLLQELVYVDPSPADGDWFEIRLFQDSGAPRTARRIPSLFIGVSLF